MAESNPDSGIITLGGTPPPRNTWKEIFDNPLTKEFILPIAKAAAKKEFGIETSNKDVAKKPFGRAMYALRDVWQGIWWTIPALAASLGLIVVLLKWLMKFLGV